MIVCLLYFHSDVIFQEINLFLVCYLFFFTSVTMISSEFFTLFLFTISNLVSPFCFQFSPGYHEEAKSDRSMLRSLFL